MTNGPRSDLAQIEDARRPHAVGPAASVRGSAGVSPALASLENLGKSFEIRNICEKIFLKLHAVGPRGERMHHAVGPAASVQGGRAVRQKEGGLGGTLFPPANNAVKLVLNVLFRAVDDTSLRHVMGMSRVLGGWERDEANDGEDAVVWTRGARHRRRHTLGGRERWNGAQGAKISWMLDD
ncbi:hypothetical protein B0H10DRAFT_1942041 [Mycena sp. CBHHK59/15]|nr:hypothetical protein B0H10DRAFT_1942041 [Mycena sp. CBHHK59/15]